MCGAREKKGGGEWWRVAASVGRRLCNMTSGDQAGRAKIGKIWRKCSKKEENALSNVKKM